MVFGFCITKGEIVSSYLEKIIILSYAFFMQLCIVWVAMWTLNPRYISQLYRSLINEIHYSFSYDQPKVMIKTTKLKSEKSYMTEWSPSRRGLLINYHLMGATHPNSCCYLSSAAIFGSGVISQNEVASNCLFTTLVQFQFIQSLSFIGATFSLIISSFLSKIFE